MAFFLLTLNGFRVGLYVLLVCAYPSPSETSTDESWRLAVALLRRAARPVRDAAALHHLSTPDRPTEPREAFLRPDRRRAARDDRLHPLLVVVYVRRPCFSCCKMEC